MINRGLGEMMGIPFENVLTLGFDPSIGKYIGTWIGSMSDYLWKYQGGVDDAGNVLSLETEGMCPKEPGKMKQVREVYTFPDADTRLFTSSTLGEDGNWSTSITLKSRRRA